MNSQEEQGVEVRPHIVAFLVWVSAFIFQTLTMGLSDSYSRDPEVFGLVIYFERRAGTDLFMAALSALCLAIAVFVVVRPYFHWYASRAAARPEQGDKLDGLE